MRDVAKSSDWRRIVAAGALWSVVYNFAWGVAWFAFMRNEWENAMAAVRQPVPWTAEVWFVWVVLTLPIGVAIMAYVARRAAHIQRHAIAATAAVWLLMTSGNVVAFGLQMSVSMRVITLDSSVNLVGMIVAACVGAWSVDNRNEANLQRQSGASRNV